jgi:hypothetical protein
MDWQHTGIPQHRRPDASGPRHKAHYSEQNAEQRVRAKKSKRGD